MIYTSYFSNLRNFPKDNTIIPISISAKAPEWYKGLQYKKLAPTYDILMKYKKDYDKEYYIEHFKEEVLSKLNFRKVMYDIAKMINPNLNIELPDFALICFEKPEDFCHRHLVAEWLISNGCKVKEFKKGENNG